MAHWKAVAKAVVVAALLAAAMGAMLAFRWCHERSRGVEIRVHNADGRTLHSVVVAVTGQSYSLGDLPAGATSSIWATPTSDSSVDVSVTDAAGQVKRLPVPHSYIEPGNSGWMLLDVTSVEARKIEDHVEAY